MPILLPLVLVQEAETNALPVAVLEKVLQAALSEDEAQKKPSVSFQARKKPSQLLLCLPPP